MGKTKKKGNIRLEEGNTETSSNQPPKKKQGPKGKKWIMVWNNYHLPQYHKNDIMGNSTYENFLEKIRGECSFFILAEEIGKINQTKHIQGYVEFERYVRPRLLMGNPFCHWGDKDGKPCIGSREDNIHYVTKDLGNDKGVPSKILLKSNNCIIKQKNRLFDFDLLLYIIIIEHFTH